MTRRLATLAVLLALQPAFNQALAQTTSGRHRPQRPEPAVAASQDPAAGHRWFFMAGGGVMAGGDVFQVVGDATATYAAPGGPSFEAREFVVTLDEAIDLALALGYRLSDRVWLRLNLSTAKMDLVALARVGQTAAVHRWDQLDVVHTGLDAEYRLVHDRSYPYVIGGVGLAAVRGARDEGLDHTDMSLRFGAGYQQYLLPAWGLRAEVRNNLVGLDFGDYVPPVPEGMAFPNSALQDKGPHQFWEILVAMQGTF